MNKALLVMDMPESCRDCKFNIAYNYVDNEGSTEDKVLVRFFHQCILTRVDGYELEWRDEYEDGIMVSNPKYYRDSFCPLKPMPEKIVDGRIWFEDTGPDGYNACIDEILGGRK